MMQAEWERVTTAYMSQSGDRRPTPDIEAPQRAAL